MPNGGTPPFTVTVALHSDEGVGRKVTIDPADGSFELKLPNGRYKVAVHPQDPGYIGPLVEPVALPPEGTLDLGSLSLLARDAVVSGTVAGGAGVSGIPLAAWRTGAPGVLKVTSGPDGLYTLAVAAGQWQVQPAPGPEQPYLYTGDGAEVNIQAGETAPGVNFELLETDATITGVLVNPAGEPVEDASGWALASQAGKSGDPQRSAHRERRLYHSRTSRYVRCSSGSAGGRRIYFHWSTAGDCSVWWADGGDANRPGQGQPYRRAMESACQAVVEGVAGVVGAWSQGNWAAAPIDAGNGVFDLDVAAGLWRLNYRPRSASELRKDIQTIKRSCAGGQTGYVPLPVLPKDGKIEGVVLDPAGNPLAGATVIAKGVNELTNDLWLKTHEPGGWQFLAGSALREIPAGPQTAASRNGSSRSSGS